MPHEQTQRIAKGKAKGGSRRDPDGAEQCCRKERDDEVHGLIVGTMNTVSLVKFLGLAADSECRSSRWLLEAH